MARRSLLALLFSGLTACSCNEPRAKPPAPHPSAHTSAAIFDQTAVVLAEAGRARVVIVVPQRVFDCATRPARLPLAERAAFASCQRLLASVEDLAKYLSRIAGSEVAVAHGEAPAGLLPILIGELGSARFGPVGIEAPGKQAFRYVVNRTAIALYGESDLASSYAAYELLDRLGCRWFMPGDLGEDIPSARPLSLPASDEKLSPSTQYRGLRYADDAYKRRNRLGGDLIAAGHVLENWVSAEQRDEHPDWRAEIKGKSDPKRLRWSKPEVADAIAQGIEDQLRKKPTDSVSISPLDGADFDDSVDKAIDAGDWDATMGQVSLTDRLLVLANRVAKRLAPPHPDLTLGLLAYTSYTRPPVRERLHPSIVPVIAPISYCRPHPWSDDDCPGAKEARQIIEGWAARSERVAYRGYAYNLAEPAAPNPMLRKWSWELPFLFANKVRFFQPETIPNFETSLPALWLGVRLSWDQKRTPSQVLQELFERFYGHASAATWHYVDVIDRAWTDTPVYAGAGLGYARRFTPERMHEAREALNAAKRACRTEVERQRVALLDQSLAQLELYMKVELDFRSGRIGGLGAGLKTWLDRASELGDRYAANSAFAKTGWAQASMYNAYAQRFLQPVYEEADRLASEQILLTKRPICSATYRVLPDAQLPLTDMPASSAADPSYDFCVDTWSSIGRHDYFGAMQYRFELALPTPVAGKRTFLWLSKVDGIAQVWVNGKLVRPRDAEASAPPTAQAYLKPLTFDVTPALGPDQSAQVTVVTQRTRLVELGAGGLLGPVYTFRDR